VWRYCFIVLDVVPIFVLICDLDDKRLML
jgi:hypothetical protein